MAKDSWVAVLTILTFSRKFSIPGFQKFVLLNERLPDVENEIMTSFMQSLVGNNILILSFQFG